MGKPANAATQHKNGESISPRSSLQSPLRRKWRHSAQLQDRPPGNHTTGADATRRWTRHGLGQLNQGVQQLSCADHCAFATTAGGCRAGGWPAAVAESAARVAHESVDSGTEGVEADWSGAVAAAGGSDAEEVAGGAAGVVPGASAAGGRAAPAGTGGRNGAPRSPAGRGGNVER